MEEPSAKALKQRLYQAIAKDDHATVVEVADQLIEGIAEIDPEEWAGLQVNRGNAFLRMSTGDRADNLDNAISAYKAALQVYPPKASFERWNSHQEGNELDLFAEAVTTARSISNESSKADALATIAQLINDPDLFAEVLTIARSFFKSDKARALATIARQRNDPDLFAEALTTARSISNKREKARALATIAQQINDPDLFAEVVTIARSVSNDRATKHAPSRPSPSSKPPLVSSPTR